MPSFRRREFLSALAIGAVNCPSVFGASRRPAHVLLRSSWQTVNIGDIAHTPGVLRILETHLPEIDVTLWPSRVDNGVEKLLQDRFPRLKIVKTSDDLKQAFNNCDFLLHGSGPSLVAEKDVIRWKEATRKPYGIYGITLPSRNSTSTSSTSEELMARTIDVLSEARFVFFRDSHSLALAKQKGCTAPVMQFGPDGAFACDLRDDERAGNFLRQHQLEAGRFLCCIPRLRYTPYWTIKNVPFDEVKHARNEAMKEHDHAQLRKSIVQVVKETALKILLCPEDRTQMTVGREMLLEPLPEEVRKRVVWRPDYWLTGEAVSTYTQSAGLFGNEMHSPIMCIGHGIPAIVCRWAEQTSKGYMWEDIGLQEWLFDLDQPGDVEHIAPTVLQMALQPDASRLKAEAARKRVEEYQSSSMDVLRSVLASL
ncbi:MAG: polysaccharide pyruvyl transferase family protein [Planctomycetaceae bacterium]